MRRRVGMITPSSNSVLEPVTVAMLAGRPDVTAHFARLRVTEIALDAPALNQFDPSHMLPAADLLADAKVGSIAWNGTSASWLGIERDENLCAVIVARTGIPATTSTLACLDAIRLANAQRAGNAQRVGIVSPYTDDVQRRIGEVWGRASVPVHAERHLGIRDNFAFGEIEPWTIADMIRAVVHDGCHVVVILCTNMNGARVAAELEPELGVLILDSVTATLWRSLQIAGIDADGLGDWGRIFREERFGKGGEGA
jgi:maleate isomerase